MQDDIITGRKLKELASGERKQMKILAVADRDPHIDIARKAEEEGADLIISLGDFERTALLSLEKTSLPKIGVYGNHDSGAYMEGLGIINMHMKTWQYMGYTFGGFQGCVRYKPNPAAVMYTQTEAEEMLKNFPAVDIFISHCPPRGINDEEEIAHQGFNGLRAYLDRCAPKVLFHGHTYPTEENLVRDYNGTRVEYVYGYKIVEIE